MINSDCCLVYLSNIMALRVASTAVFILMHPLYYIIVSIVTASTWIHINRVCVIVDTVKKFLWEDYCSIKHFWKGFLMSEFCSMLNQVPFFKCPLTSKSGTLPYFALHTGQRISLFSVNSHKKMACEENIRPNEALPRVAEWGNWDGAQRYTAVASLYLKQCRNSAVKAVHCMKVSPPPLRSFALQTHPCLPLSCYVQIGWRHLLFHRRFGRSSQSEDMNILYLQELYQLFR